MTWNVKHPVWNSEVSSPSGLTLLELFVSSNFKFQLHSALRITHLHGRGDALDVVVRQNVRFSEIIVTGTLDSHHLPVTFTILDHLITREALDPIENLTESELFQSLDSELISTK
jgi:hypothetical protein